MTLQFAWEPLARLHNDGLKELALQDWQEIDVDHDQVPLDVDWNHYATLEAAGIYRVIAARKNGRLVGYNAFFLNRHTRHRGTVFGQNDVLYLHPAQRKGMVGIRFLTESDRLLKAAGAVKVRYDVMENAPTLGVILARLGYKHEATVFTKVL